MVICGLDTGEDVDSGGSHLDNLSLSRVDIANGHALDIAWCSFEHAP